MASAAAELKIATAAPRGRALHLPVRVVRATSAFAARAVLPVAMLLALGACSMIPIPLPGRGPGPAPIADRPIDLDGACRQTDEDGYREDAHLTVRDNRVLALDWTLQVGRRGSCSFRQAEFRQTKSRPHIELSALDGSGCRLMVWQDPRRITLAHAGCENRCTPGIYDQAWPVMFDPDTGRCARP